MIPLSPNAAITLYLGLTLFALAGVWVFFYYSSKKKQYVFCRQCLYICEFCHFAYLDDTDKSVTPCPQCKVLNKNNKYQNLEG